MLSQMSGKQLAIWDREDFQINPFLPFTDSDGQLYVVDPIRCAVAYL